MLKTADLEFDLPESLIATEAVEPRDAARLLVVRRNDPGVVDHRVVRDLPDLIRSGDRMVFNRTRVVPARFVGRNSETGGAVQGLWLRHGTEPGTWVVLLKARRHRTGSRLAVARPGSIGGVVTEVELTLLGRAEDEEGAWIVRVEGDHAAAIERVGLPPLPPYILNARRRSGQAVEQVGDEARYQTVYASEPGSVAAPTAGLHFTPELLDRLAGVGVGRTEVVLHVGRGTFAPVEAEHVEEHPMHTEWCQMSPEALAEVRSTRSQGGRVIAVGTTSCRTLESFALPAHAGPGLDRPAPSALETDLLITPGFPWAVTDGLLTNFHLPRSTLLAMVGALFPEGVDRLLSIYAEAIRERYRFYSFGDAMLILP